MLAHLWISTTDLSGAERVLVLVVHCQSAFAHRYGSVNLEMSVGLVSKTGFACAAMTVGSAQEAQSRDGLHLAAYNLNRAGRHCTTETRSSAAK